MKLSRILQKYSSRGPWGWDEECKIDGEVVSREVDIAVTSGNTYTACLSIEGIEKAAHKMDLDLNNLDKKESVEILSITVVPLLLPTKSRKKS